MADLPRQRIEHDIRESLKAGEKEKLQTLRLLLTDLENKRIELGRDVEEAEFLSLVQKSLKQRRDSAEQFRKGQRLDLADKEMREAAHLETYLPQQASEEDLREAIRALVAEQELSGPAAIGPIMKSMLARFSGAADGATINRIAREVLSESK